MSISAKEARAKSMETELRINGKSYGDLLASQDRSIEYAIKDGRTSCCFSIHDTIYSNEWEDRMKEHYKALKATASDCIACRGCESRCPFGVKVSERMVKTAALFGC